MSLPPDAALVGAVDALLMAAIGLTTRSLAASAVRDVTVAQWRMLALLLEENAGIRLTDLADATGMSISSASRMANRLIARGLVDSRSDPADRRAILVTLTQYGRSTVQGVVRHRHAAVADALASRSVSNGFGEDLRVLAATLAEAARGVRP